MGFAGPHFRVPGGNYIELRKHENVGDSITDLREKYGSMFALYWGPFKPTVVCTDPGNRCHPPFYSILQPFKLLFPYNLDFVKFAMVTNKHLFEISDRFDLVATTGTLSHV